VDGEVDGAVRGSAANACEDGNTAGGEFDGELDKLLTLVVREDSELAGATAGDKAVGSSADKTLDVLFIRGFIDGLLVGGERGDEATMMPLSSWGAML
jgi:hypothetical protein